MKQETKDTLVTAATFLFIGILIGVMGCMFADEYTRTRLDNPDWVLIDMDGDDVLCVKGHARDRVPWAEGSEP